ncbi:trichothecene biosynthesis [Apiospora saccharicola]|uniref:Trichothecene biosynthesis n=1 Tax=Apiospora saccharicola TaxID=335842 RepID=A0ABR1U6C3_9PEZI
MKSILGSSVFALAAAACPTSKNATATGCPAVSGDMTISSYQLYPENADYDPKRCLVYFSAVYNSTVAAWNPQTNKVEKTLTVPGLSDDPSLHLSGVKVDPQGCLSLVVDAGSAFDTSGADISGDNFLVKYDLASDKVLWQANLTALTDGAYGGYQDVTHDARDGASFVVGTFPSSLIKVTADGDAKSWYLKTPANHTIKGFSGLVPSPDGNSLLVSDSFDGKLYRFDMAAEQGTPQNVPITTRNGTATQMTTSLDGVSIPPRWGGKVILVSDNAAGTHVLYSADASWTSAVLRGTVPNRLAGAGGFTVATVSVGSGSGSGSSVYAVTEWFTDAKVPGSRAGDRAQFPLVDITADIWALL